MEKVKIGDICEILNGYAFKSEKYVSSGIRILRIANVQKGYIEDSTPVFYPEETLGLERYMLEEGDLLISLTGNVGRVATLMQEFLPAALNQRVACLRVKRKDVFKPYLFHFLNSGLFESHCVQSSKGVAQKNMSTEWLKEYEIPLYPIEEQKEIAKTLNKIGYIINGRKEQLYNLDNLIKSRFVEMFGDPQENSMEWQETTIGDSCYYVKDGPHVSPDYVENGEGIPFISGRNIIKGYIDWSTAKYVSENDYKTFIKKCNPQKGDILYSKGGTTGIAKYVDTDIKFANWVHLAVLKFDDNLNGIFFENMLNSYYCYQQSQQLTKGIANRDLVLGSMKQISFYVPPIELQNQFATFVQQVDKLKVEVQKSLDEIQLLFDSLMQKYFE